jgi:hypothetical protein
MRPLHGRENFKRRGRLVHQLPGRKNFGSWRVFMPELPGQSILERWWLLHGLRRRLCFHGRQ